ncbi:S1C family serine protease [Youngiibacter multivorans]|uniref:Serine protease Do n=1 Tax=Youngiibacter multivorans TaxID=937251 RepID=A0ABS4G2H5_9CLOT|nr:trypsin-like peptidase domain-containing protein [Youngiibacter multivorans]MBP1918692.1 serine protease Do [Youngiibacter multivorans]
MGEFDKDRETSQNNEELRDENRSGEIRFRQDKKARFLQRLAGISALLAVIVMTSLITSTIVARRIYENALRLDTEGNILQVIRMNIENFTRDFYDRQIIRDIYARVAGSLVGVSRDPLAFGTGSYDGVLTGVVMNGSGHILVPYSVIDGYAGPIYVKTAKDKDIVLEATIVGKDKSTDTAVIMVEGLEVEPPKFGDSSSVKVGQAVLAIGNAFGDSEKGTVTFGIISTVNKLISTVTEDNREVKVYAFETDASVNRATNGGVLVSMQGDVIGVNSLDLSEDFNGGFGAAITINEARSVVRSIINTGQAIEPYMGITGNIVTEDLEGQTGYYIRRIEPESTADRAGLRPTDIILSIDGIAMTSDTTIDDYLKTKKVGETVTLKIMRVSEEQTIEATLYGTRVR